MSKASHTTVSSSNASDQNNIVQIYINVTRTTRQAGRFKRRGWALISLSLEDVLPYLCPSSQIYRWKTQDISFLLVTGMTNPPPPIIINAAALRAIGKIP
jgi:hypothetical protein